MSLEDAAEAAAAAHESELSALRALLEGVKQRGADDASAAAAAASAAAASAAAALAVARNEAAAALSAARKEAAAAADAAAAELSSERERSKTLVLASVEETDRLNKWVCGDGKAGVWVRVEVWIGLRVAGVWLQGAVACVGSHAESIPLEVLSRRRHRHVSSASLRLHPQPLNPKL
eukprot:363324-Chlamydomonas_euryale.AAC.3